MNVKVNWFFEKDQKWQAEINVLRTIVIDCALTEELKWGCPTYALGKSNIVLIHVFKEYCALLFFKGALLTDANNILIQQTENVQAARQIRFTSLSQINQHIAVIKTYILQAIEVEKAGLKVPMKKTTEFKIIEEFKTKLAENDTLKQAFENLTPGRQRAYMLHFSSAKQAKTREARIDKCIPQILAGKGLED